MAARPKIYLQVPKVTCQFVGGPYDGKKIYADLTDEELDEELPPSDAKGEYILGADVAGTVTEVKAFAIWKPLLRTERAG